ncbi:acetylcholine receptor subunit beta-like 2 isoform X2 [Thrips palmi]|uniref:Acetylcholine receptor subunit beta-like 2 isoform X2 n=1 Tax=Thrips palmi TaxID=161013 RepID=A0A6P8Z4H2_THRPL|nr:acetylcholine receptor subunit beta-like 2 isoform X2 [Thrips palmi]WGL47561.1 alpha8 [Thrips palmi]
MAGHAARRMATLKRRLKLCGRLTLLLVVFSVARPPNVDGLKQIEANPDAKRLYDDLLSHYNRLIRPVINNTETLTVHLGLRLTQLIEVNMKNQVMTTNLWVEQKWVDYKLRWSPEHYGGVEELYVPSEHIWLPDIVLYNNADGNYEVTLMTRATVKYTGEVYWKPPAIYKSSCKINVLYFPFDEQSCDMKFGSWTYNGFQVDLKHIDQDTGSNLVHHGINLKEFYLSVEWDILDAPARRNEEYEPSTCCANNDTTCCVPFSDITFNLTMRRKTLFYTINLIVPCVGITFLTVLVFYLPSASGEKVSLCISILLSLTVFFLLLAEIIPPTSLAVPLLGKYLLFTMILVTLSIFVTVCVLNVHFRSPSTHRMSPWVQRVFLDIMPRFLLMRRPPYSSREPFIEDQYPDNGYTNEMDCFRDSVSDPFSPDFKSSGFESGTGLLQQQQHSAVTDSDNIIPRTMSPDVLSALQGVCFIAQHIKDADKDNEVVEDWKYISMVLDRLFLIIFTMACVGGTAGIIFQAPSLYDTRIPIDQIQSSIPLRKHYFQVPEDAPRPPTIMSE